jgi:hypothetical protein
MNRKLVMLVFVVILALGGVGAGTEIADVYGFYGSGNKDQVNQAFAGLYGSGNRDQVNQVSP